MWSWGATPFLGGTAWPVGRVSSICFLQGPHSTTSSFRHTQRPPAPLGHSPGGWHSLIACGFCLAVISSTLRTRQPDCPMHRDLSAKAGSRPQGRAEGLRVPQHQGGGGTAEAGLRLQASERAPQVSPRYGRGLLRASSAGLEFPLLQPGVPAAASQGASLLPQPPQCLL